MNAVYSIAWFLVLCLSIALVFTFVGFSGLTRMFPEGQRNWHLPAQLASLAFFAAVVLCHPF